MAELESCGARLAARRMTAEERRHLTEVHDACRTLAEAGEVHAYYDANRRFHEVIYAGSHNAYLEETTRNMRNRLSRSEEHTSELQSLMRTSYAVFCLKKKIQEMILHHFNQSLFNITYYHNYKLLTTIIISLLFFSYHTTT